MTNIPVSESFRKRAPAAAFWEAWVGSVLTRGGLHVILHPWAIDGEDHSQTYDLEAFTIYRDGEPDTTFLEVKSLNLEFNTTEDYPFDPVLVCSQNNYRKKFGSIDNLRRDFMLVSRVTGAILWLPRGALVKGGHQVRDRERNEVYEAITAQRGDLRTVVDLIEHLLDR